MRLFLLFCAVQAYETRLDYLSRLAGKSSSWKKWFDKTVYLKAKPEEDAEAHRTERRERLHLHSLMKGKRSKRGK